MATSDCPGSGPEVDLHNATPMIESVQNFQTGTTDSATPGTVELITNC